MPVNPKESSNPSLAFSKVPFIISGKTLKSPKNINFIKAMIKPIIKKPIQI